jgi:hypothetical protein
MEALKIKISLPENLAREAEAMELLAPEAIEALFGAELDRRARAEEVAAIQIGIDEFERGEGRPARKALEELWLVMKGGVK